MDGEKAPFHLFTYCEATPAEREEMVRAEMPWATDEDRQELHVELLRECVQWSERRLRPTRPAGISMNPTLMGPMSPMQMGAGWSPKDMPQTPTQPSLGGTLMATDLLLHKYVPATLRFDPAVPWEPYGIGPNVPCHAAGQAAAPSSGTRIPHYIGAVLLGLAAGYGLNKVLK